jgi:hypothetical protein
MTIFARLKQYWLIPSLLLCIAITAGAGFLAWEFLITPRDTEITQLKEELQKLKTQASTPAKPAPSALVLPQTAVRAGTSVTTPDGRCSIRIAFVVENSVGLSVIVDANKPVDYSSARVGDRIAVEASDRIYYIDLQSARANFVDIAVYQKLK